ncbi:MAG TPA: EAL domain-containing protein [Solirubrobacteraceae bacterium]|nr:EAL domain-containing protein [Solirubrobacteraceae bacterium]
MNPPVSASQALPGKAAANGDAVTRLPALRFLELTTDIAAAMDLEGRLVAVNPALARLLETAPDNAAGRSVRDAVHAEDWLRLRGAWQELADGRTDALDLEVRIGSPGAGWSWHLASITADRHAGLVYAIAQDISARREAEERMRDAEERFRSAFEQAAIGMTITSLDGRFMRVNPQFALMVGREAEDLVDMPVRDITHPDDRKSSTVAMRALAAGEIQRHRTEKRYLRPDGSEVWVGLNVAVVRDADGAACYFLSQMADIGERRAAQQALAESERRFRTLATASPAGIFAATAEGAIRYANERLSEIFGVAGHELHEHRWMRRVHEEDRALIARHTDAARLRKSRVGLDVRIVREEDDELRWARINMAPLADPDGEVGSWIGTVEDITNEVGARQELAAREAEYRLLAEHSGDFLSRHEADGTYLYASPVCEALFGLRAEEMIGHSTYELGIVHDPDLPMLVRAGETLEVGSEPTTVEYRIVHRDGTRRWVETTFRLVPGTGPRETEIVAVTRDVHERKLAELELSRQALHDSLTGLPNRALFLDRLGQALKRAQRRGSTVAVLFLDLDRFKNVNDSLGHDAGDRLLIDVAERLRRALRPADTLARFGGDELTLLCEDLSGEADARTIATRLGDLFHDPFPLDEGEAYLQASIGIAISTGGEQAEDLIRDADAAMYRAKERGRARVEVFDEELRQVAAERLATESALRRALERDELRLHYQPVVSLEDGSLHGLEALVRWEHPERGLLMPGAFIELAEETGLIVPLGEWVLREACATLASWRERLGTDVQVAVNLSARHLQQPDLDLTVAEVLKHTGLPGDKLVLEITESAVMESGPGVLATLAALKDLGVRLAIDDFGTGYSSLSHLHRFPIDVLKIDRAFVSGLGSGLDAPIAGAIVSLAQALGLSTVAEGIEREEQRDAVRALGCDMAQGFLYARPLPPGDAEKLLA